MRHLIALGVVLGTAAAAWANDSAVEGVGGSWQPLKGEHPSVRMVRETVRMDVGADKYSVNVDITFRNNGPARTVAMGFPESGGGDVGDRSKKTAFLSFATFVDGQRVDAWRRPIKGNTEEDYDTLWIKKVPFGANQTRHITVRYKAPVGGAVARGVERFAMYDFAGGNWQGDVEESRLEITMSAPGTHLVTAELGEKSVPLERQGNTFTHVWRHWQAQGTFGFYFASTYPGWLDDGSARPLMYRGKGAVQMVRLPGGASDIEFPPLGVVRGGVTFISLQDLQQSLAEQAESAGKGLGDKEVKLTGDGAHGSILHAGRYTLTFPKGQKVMRVKNRMNARQASVVNLPATPFSIRDNTYTYVPLAPIIKVMGGTMSVNAAAHRLKWKVPMFVVRMAHVG